MEMKTKEDNIIAAKSYAFAVRTVNLMLSGHARKPVPLLGKEGLGVVDDGRE